MKSILKSVIVTILTIEAKAIIAKYRPKIVAVTGSVGKTATKDAIYTVLAGKYFVRKSYKSFNGEIGVPLTIIGCPNGWYNPLIWFQDVLKGLKLIFTRSAYPEWLVLEVGADRPGDIRKISSWLRPTVVVVTRLGKTPVHVEFFKDANELIKEKSFLVKSLNHDGILILNNDDNAVLSFKDLTQAKTITYGQTMEANIFASEIAFTYFEQGGMTLPTGFEFKANTNTNDTSVILRVKNALGFHQTYPILAGITVGISQGFGLFEISKFLENHETPKGRMRIIRGIKDTAIIDDSYNSSPIAVEEALKTLGNLKCSGRRIAVLGDMLELGKYSTEAHKEAGRQTCGSADILVTVGLRGRGIAEGALLCGMDEKNVFQFENSTEAGKFLQDLISAGDIILVKGSQGVRMEKVIEEIMAEPERKGELLVRQEKEWARK